MQEVLDYIEDGFLSDDALKEISNELAQQGKVELALALARDISEVEEIVYALGKISTILAENGDMEAAAVVIKEAILNSNKISNFKYKNNALKDISIELAKQGKLDEALELIQHINSPKEIYGALMDISIGFACQGKTEEAIACALRINNDSYKSNTLKSISIEWAKFGHWSLAEKTGLEISQQGIRNDSWKQIAFNTKVQFGWQKALLLSEKFHNSEVQKYYLKGLAEHLSVVDCNADFTLNARQKYNLDIESIETLLQKHALHELFFEKPSKNKIERFNRTLNIQWAIDLREKLN
jgi:hypothetical protein